jgi:tetratricopeptide (TPR) repeat protein
MHKVSSQNILGFILLLFLVPGIAWAESARSLVESGNEAFSQDDFAAALENYEKAAESEPDSAVVLFNKGDALYKQEQYDEALNVFEQAAAKALGNNDQMLEAQSRYNMGNSAYRRAEIFSREDLNKAFEEYKRSSGYYQSAVKLNPNLSEAAHNLEASRIALLQSRLRS